MSTFNNYYYELNTLNYNSELRGNENRIRPQIHAQFLNRRECHQITN